jgi:uncharacterized protein (TIGR00369 family)
VAKLLDVARQMMRGDIPPAPVATLVGFTLDAVEPGAATVTFVADDTRHANPMGTLHGGVLCDITDAAMGMAYAATLEDGESFTTLELKINFVRAVRNGRLTAQARLVHAGRSIGFLESDVTDEEGHLIARASSTCLRLRR